MGKLAEPSLSAAPGVEVVGPASAAGSAIPKPDLQHCACCHGVPAAIPPWKHPLGQREGLLRI